MTWWLYAIVIFIVAGLIWGLIDFALGSDEDI